MDPTHNATGAPPELDRPDAPIAVGRVPSRARLPAREVAQQVARASAVVALGAIPAFLTGALAVQMRSEFALSSATLGLLVGLFFGCAAIASGPAGWSVQRFGAGVGMRASFLGSALCMAGIALFARDATSLALFLILGGLANALANPAANLLLVRSVPAHRRALALGVKQAAIPAATLLAGLSIPVLALTLGWRWAFGSAALVAVLLAVGWDTTRSNPATSSAASAPRAGSSAAIVGSRVLSAGRLNMFLLAAGGTLAIWGGQAMGTFLVSYAVDRGVGEAAAGLLLTVASLAGIVARIAAGWVVDRRRGSGLGELRVLLAAGTVGLLALATGLPGLIWLGAIAAFAGGWGWSGVLTYAVVRANPAAPAAATGITQAGIFVGATLGVPLFGVLVEATSYATAWIGTAASAAIAVVIMTIVARRLPGTDR